MGRERDGRALPSADELTGGRGLGGFSGCHVWRQRGKVYSRLLGQSKALLTWLPAFRDSKHWKVRGKGESMETKALSPGCRQTAPDQSPVERGPRASSAG